MHFCKKSRSFVKSLVFFVKSLVSFVRSLVCFLSRALKDFFRKFQVIFLIFLGFLADLGEIRPTGRTYRPRSPFCPGRWAENFFEKICLVPLLLEFWIFNDRLFFCAFYGLSSQNHYSDELRADLISPFPVLISLLVQILSVLCHFFRRRSEKKSFRAPPSNLLVFI